MELTNYNEITALLNRHGFRFSKSMGQNFLTARWVPEEIAEGAMIDENTGVLEVGPGIGCLTAELSQRAGKVVSVELDKSLKPVLAETLEGRENVEIVFADVLKLDIGELVKEKFQGLRPVICANLPYNVTTPLITAFIESGCFDSITVMIQREVAKRICAEANTADYGAFGIFVNYYMEPEMLFDVPPSCFVPQPKVTSSVIRMKKRQEPPVKVKDEELLFKVVRAAFNQRRKTLCNALSSAFGNLDKEIIQNIIEKCGFDSRIRGEVLDIGGFAKISDEIYSLISSDL